MVCVRVSDITNPPLVPCSVLDPSVKQQMPWELASILSELSLFFVVLECLFFAINVCAAHHFCQYKLYLKILIKES